MPQKNAPSIPATANAVPASVPWMIPMNSVPRNVARVTDVNLSKMRS